MIYILIPTTKERRERLDVCISHLRESFDVPSCILTYENKPRGAIKAMFEMIEGLKDDALVWWIQDDIEVSANALKILSDNYTDGVCVPDDGIQHGKLCTVPFCTVKTLKEYTHEGYYHNWADVEFTKRLKEEGKYHYIPHSKVEHQHWVNGQAVNDATYQHAALMEKQDAELYKQRNENN